MTRKPGCGHRFQSQMANETDETNEIHNNTEDNHVSRKEEKIHIISHYSYYRPANLPDEYLYALFSQTFPGYHY